MTLQSDKTLYGNQFKDTTQIIWSDDLASGNVVTVYSGNFKMHPVYRENRSRIYKTNLIIIEDGKPILLPVYKNRTDGTLYLSESEFDTYWSHIRCSVSKGITNRGGDRWSITSPEELLDLSLLEKKGRVPVVEDDKIIYESPKMLANEEDFPYIYVLDPYDAIYHDKDCDKLHGHPVSSSKEIREGSSPCPHCYRRLLIRQAVDDETMINGILTFLDDRINDAVIEKLVMEKGAKLTLDKPYELTIHSGEDTFKIKERMKGGHILLHNNYIVMNDGTDRLISKGFHKQRGVGRTMEDMLCHIIWYDFKAGHHGHNGEDQTLGKPGVMEIFSLGIRKLGRKLIIKSEEIRIRGRERRIKRSVSRLLSLGRKLTIWKNDEGAVCIEYEHVSVSGIGEDIIGTGSSLDEAARDYLRKLEGKTLIFNDRENVKVL